MERLNLFVLEFSFFFFLLYATGVSQEKKNQVTGKSEEIRIIETGTITKERIEKIKGRVKERNPKIAGLYSAILPGLGQYYNRARWWKYPLYLGLIGGGVYFIKTEHANYRRYRNEYINRLNRGEDESILRTFANLADEAERNRTLAIVYTSIFYLANIIDAVVDAHLSRFEVDKDLSFHPVLLNINNSKPFFGIQVNMCF